MSHILTASTAAAFPDRPGALGLGLRADLSSGSSEGFVQHAVADPGDVLHIRFMLQPGDAAGGLAVLLGAIDDDGTPIAQLVLDLDAGVLLLEPSDALAEQVDLPAGLSWQCIELALDRAADRLTLWINGLQRATLDTPLAWADSLTLRLGPEHRSVSATGALGFDEWIIADGYIGPVLVEPVSPYADDPARWLVIYNRDDADSVAFAAAYRAARGVPFANLLGLPLASAETIDAAGYGELVLAIRDYLQRHGLDEQVMGLLLGFGVPGYADFATGLGVEAIGALLHRDSETAWPTVNANAGDTLPTRVSLGDLGGDRLTARIDAPDLTAALALLGRATQVSNAGLGTGDDVRLYLDPYPAPTPTTQPITDAMRSWAQHVDRMQTRLPFMLSAEQAGYDEAAFAALNDDSGFFWGWSSSALPTGFFPDMGARVFSLQIASGAQATTLRSATPGNWIDAALASGFAAAAATARPYSPDSIPLPRPFFAALRRLDVGRGVVCGAARVARWAVPGGRSADDRRAAEGGGRAVWLVDEPRAS